tara:strand:- start:583 stop:861 length:279 start_codon:yes stop_codon:yes gene_type:complete
MLEMNGEYWEDTPEGQVLKHKMGGLQLATALIGLKFEVEVGVGGMQFTRISSLGVLKRYFHGLKRTKAGAYQQLVDAKMYEHFVKEESEDEK